MTNIELIKQLIKRLKKFSWLILLLAIGFAGFFYYMAKQSLVLYTSKATVFPLNSSGDNSVTSSTISNILGLSDAPKSFSGEASINIVELATSRRTREAVAMERIPSMQNKSIAQLLIEEHNRHTGFMQNEKIKMPQDSMQQNNIGSSLLKGGFSAKINKNGILELYYSNTSTDLVRAVSYVYIDKISSFYIDLKKKKAQIDFEFAVKKADSLLVVLNSLDQRAIALDESTFFTNEDLKRYSLPKQNLMQDKSTVQSQYYYAVNNREAAAYKLQKETPIIEPLDKPEPPFDSSQKSSTFYILIGFMLGLILGIILVSFKIINRFLGEELNKAIEKATRPKPVPADAPLK
ncbi:MAG: hypothetical protein IPP31_06750 [Chitinophagaceae bacterium]|nr:hypothetical protein [Chitinophagaceae bacterium]